MVWAATPVKRLKAYLLQTIWTKFCKRYSCLVCSEQQDKHPRRLRVGPESPSCSNRPLVMNSLGVHVPTCFYVTRYHVYISLVKAFTDGFLSYSSSSEGVNLVPGECLYLSSK